jgi:hypothetical protein
MTQQSAESMMELCENLLHRWLWSRSRPPAR